MSFGIPNTPDNRVLSAVVHRRINSDASRVTAIATVIRLLGLGAFCLLMGGGVGLALFGYSYVTDNRTTMEKLSSAIADALHNAVLKVDGTVGVTGAVPLDTTGATVGLDTTGATVRLDTKGAMVSVDAKTIPHPSTSQLTNPATPASNAKTVTDYTVFKHVDIGNGQVITGWNFVSNDDTEPSHQYCYYTTKMDDNVTARFNIATNRVPVPVRGLPIDVHMALANCVWFDASANHT